MSLSIGIVGLPNVGKSTLFTALTNKGGLAANYPFATIEPNVGIVPVPDDRLEKLAEIDHPAKIVPATVEFVDIAGLVAGASQGEGLGNQFLANIRETDAICEVVRFFSDPDVVHVDGRVNPSSDVETIKTELILADMGTLDKAIPRLEKEAKRDKAGVKKLEVAKKVLEGLNEGHRARTLNLDEDEQAAIYDLHLLTMKPILYIANVDEDALDADLAEIDGCQPVPISAKVEADLAELDPAEAKEYLEAMGLEESGLARLVRSAYKLLGLQSYFTSGETETRAWTIPIGAKAPQAAGVIHSDFERGFIKAETASYSDYVELGGELGCRNAGKLRQEGKSTWCRTATLCILSSTFKTPVQSHVLGSRRKRSLLFSTCNALGQKADQRTSRGESGKPASPRAYLRCNGGGVGVGWEVERLPCCCFRMRGAQWLLPSERITVSLLRSACGLFAHARKTIWLAYNRPVRKLFGCARRGLLYVRRRMLGVRQGASR